MFKGLFTAIITPFENVNSFDYRSLYNFIDKQINILVDEIVLLGTTGESPTISKTEEKILISKASKYVSNKTILTIGTGSNCTQTSINKSKYAEEVGVDGLLVVNPYYNKPTQKGMYGHFTAIVDLINTPII